MQNSVDIMETYMHTKSGGLYFTLGCATNKTTGCCDGKKLVLYQCQVSGGIFAREATEFKEKFTKLN